MKKGASRHTGLRQTGSAVDFTLEGNMMNAVECAKKAGKYGFGVDEARTAQLLRELADDIEMGRVALRSVSTSNHASDEEFTVRELVIEVLEEIAVEGPRVVKR
jgi:hypothetical protein